MATILPIIQSMFCAGVKDSPVRDETTIIRPFYPFGGVTEQALDQAARWTLAVAYR